jgi:hypothetical protein
VYWKVPAYLPGAPFAHTFFQLLWFPIAFLPEQFLESIEPTDCLGGYICLFPTRMQLLLMIVSPIMVLISLSLICVLVSNIFKNLSLLPKYGVRLGVLVFIIIFSHIIKVNLCIKSYKEGKEFNEFGETSSLRENYLSGTGILLMDHDDKAKNYSNFFNVETIYSKQIDLIRVPKDQEFSYACKMKDYSLIKYITPLDTSNFDIWRQRIDN